MLATFRSPGSTTHGLFSQDRCQYGVMWCCVCSEQSLARGVEHVAGCFRNGNGEILEKLRVNAA